MQKITLLAVAAFLLTAPALAQSDNEMSSHTPALGTTLMAEDFVK